MEETKLEKQAREQEEQDIINDIHYEESREMFDYTHR